MKRLKQFGAILAILILLGFGAGAMIFAFLDTPWSQTALSICLFCAITVPVLLYAMMLVAKVLTPSDKNEKKENSHHD